MKRKSITGIIISTILVIGLTACSSAPSASSPSQSTAASVPQSTADSAPESTADSEAQSTAASAASSAVSSESSAETSDADSSASDADNSEDDLSSIKSAGVLKIGTEGAYSPYSYHDDSNKLTGFDVEIAALIAEKLGVKAEYEETKWDSMVAGLDSKRFDVVINQVSITDERKAKYDFSTPYTYTRGALITKKDNTDIKTFEDLKGKKSAQSLTSNWADTAKGYGADIVSTDGFNQSIDLVVQGRADATLNDDITFYDYIKQKPDANVQIAAKSDDVSKSAVLIRKGNSDLVKAVNQALSELESDGTLSELSNRYFGTDVTKE